MNIVVIGGVAAGTKTAAKVMRQDRSARVTIYTKTSPMPAAACPTTWAGPSSRKMR